MQRRSNHLIQKASVLLHMKEFEHSFALQKKAEHLLLHDSHAQLDAILSELVPGNEMVKIDLLHLDLGNISEENFEQEFREKFLDAIKNSLVKKITATETHSDASQLQRISVADVFFYFLLHGVFPAWWIAQPWDDFEEEILSEIENRNVSFAASFFLLMKNENAVQRFLFQFSERIQRSVIESIIENPQLPELSPKVVRHFRGAGSTKNFGLQKNEFHLALQRVLDEIKRLAASSSEELLLSSEEPSRSSEKKLKQEKVDEPESIYIENSGLVILHPFIPALFKELDMLDEDGLIKNDVREKAALLLHYLCTGNMHAHEHELVLNKIFCGIPFGTPLPVEAELTEPEKNEADKLLDAVIHHWSALKNTSPDGLRSAFLLRNGKLSKKESGWLLQVEQKTEDILLNRLQWGISVIQLPWMKEMLNVEWI